MKGESGIENKKNIKVHYFDFFSYYERIDRIFPFRISCTGERNHENDNK